MKYRMISSEDGFTIVELMVALSVFAVILMMSTVIMINIANLYNKGVNEANLQNTSRNIISDISSSIQFTGNISDPTGCNGTLTACWAQQYSYEIGSTSSYANVYSYCIGSTRYSYVLDTENGTNAPNQLPHVLWRDTLKNISTCPTLDLTSSSGPSSDSNAVPGSGFDMLPPHMRIDKFFVDQTGPNSGLYAVDIWIAYGDDDLLTIASDGSATCSGGVGTQFCAVSALNTTVTKRLD